MDATGDRATCIRSMHLMATGTLEEFEDVYAAEAHNRESMAEPPATRAKGPGAFYASALWLREAFSGLEFDVHDTAQDGELVAVHASMSGRQTGPFVAYGPDARPAMVFPPTGRRFTVTQTHWFRLADGEITEHWANRDDRSMGEQLGWTPPSPLYLARMLLARRTARRGAGGSLAQRR